MKLKLRVINIIKNLLNPLLNDETKYYLKTWYNGRKDRSVFKDVRTYCMFIGSGRTGHTLIASLIDAHPNAIISNELNAIRYIKKGYRKNQLFSMILANSKKHIEQGKIWTGYSYFVENQMQGDSTKLLVIGDKKGGITSEIILQDPDLLFQMIKKWKINFKFLHVVRNPYDVISSMTRRGELKNFQVNGNLLEENIHRFFKRMETVLYLKSKLENSILEIYHECFIKNPKEGLEQILTFLGLTTTQNYLEDCSRIVNRRPSYTRKLVVWSASQIKWVFKESRKYPFLAGYSFEDL